MQLVAPFYFHLVQQVAPYENLKLPKIQFSGSFSISFQAALQMLAKKFAHFFYYLRDIRLLVVQIKVVDIFNQMQGFIGGF